MDVLIIGANGQVGSSLRDASWPSDWLISGLDHGELDITDADDVRTYFVTEKPDIVVNAAAYTNVDQAENETDLCWAVNAVGPKHIATAADEIGAVLFQISTDYVFSGEKSAAYTEEDPVAPLSTYGASKAAGEDAVRDNCSKHFIIRTGWLYSTHGHNFAKTILKLAQERPELTVVADQIGTPTSVAELSNAIVNIAKTTDKNPDAETRYGTYHFSCAGQASWYEFAEAVVSIAAPFTGALATVKPTTTEQYPTLAKRPAKSVLNCTRFDNAFGGTRPLWRDALRPVVESLCGQHNA